MAIDCHRGRAVKLEPGIETGRIDQHHLRLPGKSGQPHGLGGYPSRLGSVASARGV